MSILVLLVYCLNTEWTINRTPGDLVLRNTYENENYPTFLAVLNQFIADASSITSEIDCACFAVAGPVKQNRASLTNKNAFVIDGSELAVATKIKIVTVINDFVGAGYGVLTLNDKTECVCIQVMLVIRIHMYPQSCSYYRYIGGREVGQCSHRVYWPRDRAGRVLHHPTSCTQGRPRPGRGHL